MIVTFTDYIPPPRLDGVAWNQILIEEGATDIGPWNLLETKVINPVDPDPTQPSARSFTTTLATLVAGWYRITFKDPGGNTSVTDPVHNFESTDVNFRPSISLVARKIISRTRDQYGAEKGTFTNTTKPTTTQAADIITDILTEVADTIGDTVPDVLTDDAQNVAALRAAMQIELDYFSEQVNTGRSIYPQLQEQYKSALASLQKQITLIGEGETRVSDSGASLSPSYSFPDASNWGTRRW